MRNKKLNIVLAGQANVGKSVIFNYLTGLHQHIGNWAGKTVEKAEGTLYYKGHTIDILDLPGIYSLSTYSLEEVISREYIAIKKPDFIINVVDATHLERNLIFTLQLLELERPMVMALNMVNLLKGKGLAINGRRLGKMLGIKVVPVEAVYGRGINKCLLEGMTLVGNKVTRDFLRYGRETEERIVNLVEILGKIKAPYPTRWIAIKLLEKDKQVADLIGKEQPAALEKAQVLCAELEKIHGHDSSVVIADERCNLASRIISEVMKIKKPQKLSFGEGLDNLTGHMIWGYPVMLAILSLVFISIFQFGNYISFWLEKILLGWQFSFQAAFGETFLASLAWSGIESAFALFGIILPFILPFYLLLFVLEDWGYLARVAFLLDNLMHKLGVHGKACIPIMLGFGCNTSACLSCRIMETQREKFLTGFLVTLVPCSAVSVIILGLVGKYVGMVWVFGLYAFVILLAIILGVIAARIMPGEPTALIMDMPDYRVPNIKTVFSQTWFKIKEFIFVAGPLIIISGVIIEALYLLGWLNFISNFLSPLTSNWLGLPAITGTLLIFGILRKELILVMLATLLGTTNFAQVLTPIQMVILGLVSMLYIPCLATITVLWKEFGWKRALGIAVFKVTFAIFIGGLVFRLLNLVKII